MADQMTNPVLDINNLVVSVGKKPGGPKIIDGISIQVREGETLCLVGESGSGKSVTSLTTMGLLPKGTLVPTSGSVKLVGEEILTATDRRLRQLRATRMAMIFQEPMTALNPLATVGRQIAEMFVLHQGSTWHEAERKAIAALAQVQVPAPDKRIKNYPHQMSGGMRQRVMIAIALACHPDLLIADEPTTALDVTVQAEILKLMQELCDQRGTSVLMISHDLGVIAKMCQRVGIMYAGHLVEERAVADLFRHPAHPYTHGLLASLPVLGQRKLNERKPLQEIEGIVPSIAAFPTGCRFEPRCKRASPICRDAVPGPSVLGDHSFVRCYHHG